MNVVGSNFIQKMVMQKLTRGIFHYLIPVTLIMSVGFVFDPGIQQVRAVMDLPPGPDRYTSITIKYTNYEWWMANWSDNEVVCQIHADHEGVPTLGDIFTDCDKTISDNWKKQAPCPQETYRENPKSCDGYYVYFFSSTPAEREIAVVLPPPLVWISLENCNSGSMTNICQTTPVLVLTGDESLPNESILRIEGTLNSKGFTCEGSICKIQIKPTSKDSAPLEFWAFSSYGDSSEIFKAQIRVAELTDQETGLKVWYVDVLSKQWAGEPVASCAETWESLPPVGGPPTWLSTPKDRTKLASDIPYAYLAGNLITQGVVNVSRCPNGGLLPEGGASACGLRVAQSAVTMWQNRFDRLIMKVSLETSVPAQLLKNLFARESQFWPGIFKNTSDVGLGQLTENGADTTFLWNPSFYEQFCPLVLENTTCKKGYLHLKEKEREILQYTLVQSVNANCTECPLGLDLTQADFSVSVFAHSLLASCEQAGQIVRNVTHEAPGEAATYEDMWRFTLVNYNAGPGCLSVAIKETYWDGKPLDWEHVIVNLEPACEAAIGYVEDIGQE